MWYSASFKPHNDLTGASFCLFFMHTFAPISSLISPPQPLSNKSHDQPNPEATSTGLLTNSPCTLYPSLSPPLPHPTSSVPRCRNNTTVCVGLRCGRAVLSVSLPPNNALTEEAKAGGGLGEKNEGREEFSLWLHSTLFPLTCGPQ